MNPHIQNPLGHPLNWPISCLGRNTNHANNLTVETLGNPRENNFGRTFAMKSPLRILLLEDNQTDAELILATLEQEGIGCAVERVETRETFLQAVEKNGFDLIISDCSLPPFDGVSALKVTLEKLPLVPFIFISGTMGEELAVETLKRGATDYVLKSQLARLGPAVRRAVSEAAERVPAQDTIRLLAERETVLRSFFDSPGAMRGIVEIIDDDIVHIADNAESAAFFGRASRKNKLAAERKTLDLWISCYDQCKQSEMTGLPTMWWTSRNRSGRSGKSRTWRTSRTRSGNCAKPKT
jgi:CheY-like chemotaxis protein